MEFARDPEERERQNAALCGAANLSAAQCKNYIYVDAKTKKGHYYVGIFKGGQSGQDADFGSLNSVTAALQQAIQDPHLARLHIVAGNEDFVTGPRSIAQLTGNGEGATVTLRGETDIYILDPNYHDKIHDRTGYSDLDWFQKASWSPFASVPRTIETVMLHEVGHFLYRTQHPGEQLNSPQEQKAAVDLENKVRLLKGPNAPLRANH
jgi:hypothetical protein